MEYETRDSPESSLYDTLTAGSLYYSWRKYLDVGCKYHSNNINCLLLINFLSTRLWLLYLTSNLQMHDEPTKVYAIIEKYFTKYIIISFFIICDEIG